MKRIKHICLFLFATLMMSPNPALAKMYKWVDEKGKTHFTDNRMNIPPQYRTPEKKSLAGKKEKKRVALGGGFPLEILGDWKIAKRGSLQYKLVFTDKRDGYEPDCALDEFKRSGSFEEFKNYLQAWVKESYKEYRVVSESAFSAKNLKGVKIIERFIDKVGKSVRRESSYFKV